MEKNNISDEKVMELRPYQTECVRIVDALPDGSRSVVVLATGLGKTVVAANFHFEGRMLWLSHRDELVRQPEKYFRARGYSYGIEKAKEHSHGEDVVSASIQSISRDDRLRSFSPDDFSVIICDEAHHAAASTYKKVLQYFHPKKLIGLTATPQRGDNVRLTDVFDDICFARDLKWGIKNGYLAPIRCMRVYADFDLANVKKNGGDYILSDVDREMDSSNDDLIVARAYLDTCLPEGRQTIIYCPTVRVCQAVLHTIQTLLPEEEKGTVRMLSNTTLDEERTDIIDGFRKKDIHCLVNCMILTEGTDLPETSAIINNRPSANKTLYTQIVGRGTRLAEGKEYCLIIDVVGKNARSAGLCTAPTLFGEDPNLLPEQIVRSLEGKDLLEACEELSAEHAQQAKNIRLVREMIDIFTQEKIDMIKANAKRGPGAIADSYADAFIHTDDGIDFGDLMVEKLPYTNRRYQIRATYNGHIWLSEPDMLGKTVMEFDIPASDTVNEREVSFLSDPLSIDKAVCFIQDFLKFCIPDFNAVCWSLSKRERMEALPASEKQVWRVQRDFRGWGVPNGKMNKRQASDLINLSISLEALQHQADNMDSRIADAGKRRTGKALTAWMQKQAMEREAIASATEKKKEAYKEQVETITREIDKHKLIQKKREEEEKKSIGKTLSSSLLMDYSYRFNDDRPSLKQIEFLKSLAQTCIRNGYVFDIDPDPTALGLSKWHTGFLINFCLMFSKSKRPGDGIEYLLYMSDFVEKIRKIPGEMPRMVDCKYLVRRKSA